jgi:hypothetical protein
MDDQNRPQSRATRGSVQLTTGRMLLHPEGGGGEVRAGGSRRRFALGAANAGGGAQRLAPRMAKANVATAPAVRA